MRVGLPMRWLSPSRYHYARSVLWHLILRLHSRCEVHDETYRTEHTGRVEHQSYELSKISFAPQVDDSIEWWMMMMKFSDLYKEQCVGESVDDLLIACRFPPLDCVIELPTGVHYPKRHSDTSEFFDLRDPGAFGVGKMNVTSNSRWSN